MFELKVFFSLLTDVLLGIFLSLTYTIRQAQFCQHFLLCLNSLAWIVAGGSIELSSPPYIDDITNTMGTQHAMCPHMCTNTAHCTCHQEYLIGIGCD